MKFKATAEDTPDSNSFQGFLVVALVRVDNDGYALEDDNGICGEYVYYKGDDQDKPYGDIHGFYNSNLPWKKYEYFAIIDEKTTDGKWYAIRLPKFVKTGWSPNCKYDIYITPGWFDFQGKVVLSDFHLTNSNLYEEFRPAEVMADKFMEYDANEKFTTLGDDSTELQSAFGMELRDYDLSATNNIIEVKPYKAKYRFDMSNTGKIVINMYRDDSSLQSIGSLTLNDAGNSSGTWGMTLLSYYNSNPKKMLCVGYKITRGQDTLALVRINGDGTLMIKDLISIATLTEAEEYLPDEQKQYIENEKERVIDQNHGLKLDYSIPSTPSDFPVEFFRQTEATFIALAQGLGLSLHAVHTHSMVQNIINNGMLNNFIDGARDFTSSQYRNVWWAKDKVTSTESIETNGYQLWPFLNQTVWVNVLPPKNYPGSAPKKIYVSYHLKSDDRELFPTKSDPSESPPYTGFLEKVLGSSLAATVWDHESDYFILFEDMCWKAWEEAFEPIEPQTYYTHPDQSQILNQTKSLTDFLTQVSNASKKAILYVSPTAFVKGTRVENVTMSLKGYAFYDKDKAAMDWAYGELGFIVKGFENDEEVHEVADYANRCYGSLNDWASASNGKNYDEYLKAIWDANADTGLLKTLNDNSQLRQAGFYFDNLYGQNLPGSYYVIRKVRQLYYNRFASNPEQPVMIFHASTACPLFCFWLQTPICEAYADYVYKVEVGGAVPWYEYNYYVSDGYAEKPSTLDEYYKYVYSTKNRSNSFAAMHTSELIAYDSFWPSILLPKIYERSLSYAQKYSMVFPFMGCVVLSSDMLTFENTTMQTKYDEIFQVYAAWVMHGSQTIDVTDLDNYKVSGTVTVDAVNKTVTLAPGTTIELPVYAAIQFRVSGSKYRLIIGSLGSQSVVTIQGQSGARWTGFMFYPMDRYGVGPDAAIEILSPFAFNKMVRPFRFYQITKGMKMVY